jgi:hypothetical protein
MEEKNMRELTLEDMEKVSGGTDQKDFVDYWVKDHPCPKCGEKDANFLRLEFHTDFLAQIECQIPDFATLKNQTPRPCKDLGVFSQNNIYLP